MKRKKVLIGAILIVAVLIMMGKDFYLAKENKAPRFSILIDTYKDGGTKVYLGLGYKVIDYNQMDGRNDVAFIPFYIDLFEMK